ncbi:MAG: hypothetical protein KJN79_05175, partial [Gammaproteobacteria bacterium]|nr:hypothetical protein [Gammaproteobacteria bacterium]
MSPSAAVSSLHEKIDACLLRDRRGLYRKARRLRGASGDDPAWLQLEREIQHSCKLAAERSASLPTPGFPQDLPITERLDEIRELIRCNQVIVL